jgi:hypothetical protein
MHNNLLTYVIFCLQKPKLSDWVVYDGLAAAHAHLRTASVAAHLRILNLLASRWLYAVCCMLLECATKTISLAAFSKSRGTAFACLPALSLQTGDGHVIYDVSKHCLGKLEMVNVLMCSADSLNRTAPVSTVWCGASWL